MKKLYIILVIMLSGCSLFPQKVAKFDNIEYSLANKIYTLTGSFKAGCNDPSQTKINFNLLAATSIELMNYSTDIPNNVDATNIVSQLSKTITDASAKFNSDQHSVSYCTLKLTDITISAGIAKNAIAQKRTS